MSDFRASALVQHPVEAVFPAARDGLANAVGRVEELEAVERHRVDLPDGRVEVSGAWRARLPVPASFASLVPSHVLVWEDRALWSSREQLCQWWISSPYFGARVRCGGVTRFSPARKLKETTPGFGAPTATRIDIEGSFIIEPDAATDAEKVREIEEFVCAMLPFVFRKVTDALSSTLTPPRSLGASL